MFKTHMGPVPDEDNAVYLRPETAQAMFVDFPQIQSATRKKVPFGIAQIGKSFRNEITPGNFLFRTREFEQMEMEFFVEPGTDEAVARRMDRARASDGTWTSGSSAENLRLREHERGRTVALLEANGRHRVPVPVHGLGRARRHREPHRLRPEGARGERAART